MIRLGSAKVDPSREFKYFMGFRELEKAAESKALGGWGDVPPGALEPFLPKKIAYEPQKEMVINFWGRTISYGGGNYVAPPLNDEERHLNLADAPEGRFIVLVGGYEFKNIHLEVDRSIDYTHMTGRISNKTPIVRQPFLDITAFGYAGEVLGLETIYTSEIAPGGEKSFECSFPFPLWEVDWFEIQSRDAFDSLIYLAPPTPTPARVSVQE